MIDEKHNPCCSDPEKIISLFASLVMAIADLRDEQLLDEVARLHDYVFAMAYQTLRQRQKELVH